jgi:hypothetical protein
VGRWVTCVGVMTSTSWNGVVYGLTGLMMVGGDVARVQQAQSAAQGLLRSDVHMTKWYHQKR